MKTKEGLWRLSPSGLYTYSDCQSCFWADNHFKKPPMLPLLLNSAMDSILKSRYDQFREQGAFPPEAESLLEEKAQPFTDLQKLNLWRNSLTELRIVNEDVGYMLQGKIDDVMVEEDGRLIPADYKSSGNPPSEDKQKYYRDQLAAYGLMFKQGGFQVSDRAYLLHYFVKDKNDPSDCVQFDCCVDKVDISVDEIESKISLMVSLLNGTYPGPNPDCEKCEYYEGRLASIVGEE